MSNIGSEQWDECKTDNDKLRFVSNLKLSEVPDATKYWIRSWMRSSDWDTEDIQNVLGSAWK
tara:strand:+ start:407 stop:592 length:186 start_codon:yes stop_codon:yes gene_type:complete